MHLNEGKASNSLKIHFYNINICIDSIYLIKRNQSFLGSFLMDESFLGDFLRLLLGF